MEERSGSGKLFPLQLWQKIEIFELRNDLGDVFVVVNVQNKVKRRPKHFRQTHDVIQQNWIKLLVQVIEFFLFLFLLLLLFL